MGHELIINWKHHKNDFIYLMTFSLYIKYIIYYSIERIEHYSLASLKQYSQYKTYIPWVCVPVCVSCLHFNDEPLQVLKRSLSFPLTPTCLDFYISYCFCNVQPLTLTQSQPWDPLLLIHLLHVENCELFVIFLLN